MGGFPVASDMTIQYNGLFDFDGLYIAIIDWAKHYGYMWHEIDYKHKVPQPTGAEQEWRWSLTKNVTDFIRFEIIFTVHSWDLREVEVVVNGKKKPLSNARISIKMHGEVKWDWQKKFSGSKFSEWLGKIYERLIQKDLESVWHDQLYYRMINLQSLIKKYFDVQSKKNMYEGYLGEN